MAGAVGRQSGGARLGVIDSSDRATPERVVVGSTAAGTAVNTDEWGGYARLPDHDRPHATVRHTPGDREWARDDDGDGTRGVHSNTAEGLWTGPRNFLRPLRGVGKHYLGHYVAVFQWVHNLKAVTESFLRLLLGTPPAP